LFGVFFALLVVRVPVAFALGLACLPVLVIEERLSPMTLFNETFKAYNSFILLAVPFFLLTANLMNVGGITDRLVRLSRTMVGHFPGALAQINVLLSVFFAGISGSSTADAASYSKIYNYPVYPRSTFKEFLLSGWQSIPALFTPFIIVGGILLGWFTPTESAAVAVLYAAVLSIFIYREMDMRHLYHALADTGRL